MLKLPTDVFYNRIEKMQGVVKEQGLDAVIIASNETETANVRYFTDYSPKFETAAILIPAESEALLLSGPEGGALLELHSRLKEYRKLLEFRESSDPEYPDIEQHDFNKVFSEINGGKPVKKLGLIGTNIMTVQVYEGILKACNGAELVKCDDLLRNMRMIKTTEELELMKRASEIAQRGFDWALGRIKPGMTEFEVEGLLVQSVMMEGAEGTGFQIWCVSGPNTNQAIGRSTHRVIERNEIVQVTMGAAYEGYVGTFGRPFSFGKPSDKALELLKIGLDANKITHQMLREGINAGTVANEVHGYIRKTGFGDYIVYGPCHGTGMMECEYPFIESTSDYILKKGMTFAVDTFLGGKDFGMRYEDAVAITHDGEMQLSRPQQEIIIL
jgi:Xaa-Pro aminopeptidase